MIPCCVTSECSQRSTDELEDFLVIFPNFKAAENILLSHATLSLIINYEF